MKEHNVIPTPLNKQEPSRLKRLPELKDLAVYGAFSICGSIEINAYYIIMNARG